jgi:hypothetical protein
MNDFFAPLTQTLSMSVPPAAAADATRISATEAIVSARIIFELLSVPPEVPSGGSGKFR